AGATALTLGGRAQAQTTTFTDADVLNFALNLEYLEAQFYSFAAFGAGLSTTLTASGGGTAGGTVTGGKQVTFTDPIVAQYAREIAADEVAHVGFLRSALGVAAVAMPNIDISATGAFTSAALAAGVIAAGGTFDPYASDENFLLGAFIFEDVGVTAYKGASILLNSALYLDAAAGILAVEAYHAGLVRTALYAKGLALPSLRTQAGQISDARDSLDGASDLDQGIIGTATASNITPADGNGLAFTRSAGQVLNIVYLNKNAVVGGGFFPNGVNGNIKTSAAN
ncbi:MAG: ferritin-like domain-containing protein, partial [Sphingomonas sp.]